MMYKRYERICGGNGGGDQHDLRHTRSTGPSHLFGIDATT
jgi:hypothetical protein